ncbi:MAG: preprotein translocase subunit SecE [Candidatus Obscuribacterales bacterium]
MALKKRKKISSKKLRVDKASDSADGAEKDGGQNGSDSAGMPPVKPPAKGGGGGGGDGSGKGGGAGKSGPGKSGPGKTREAGGFAGYHQFLREVLIEYRKITWPDRQQITKETWSVLVLVTFITFLVLGYDFALGKIFAYVEHLSRIYAGG